MPEQETPEQETQERVAPQFRCECCGNDYPQDEHDENYIGDQRLCDQCYNEESGSCVFCSEVFWSDDLTYIEACDGLVCDYCVNEHTSICEHCESTVMTGDLTLVGGADQYWCDDCLSEVAIYCSSCEAYYSVGITYRGETCCPSCTIDEAERVLADLDGSCECNDCTSVREEAFAAINMAQGGQASTNVVLRNRQFICIECGRRVRGPDNWVIPDPEDLRQLNERPADFAPRAVYCTNCRMVDGQGRTCYTVRSYSYRPQPIFLGTTKDMHALQYGKEGDPRQLFFGVEVEVQSSGADYRSALADMNELDVNRMFFCKSDASIGGGFEVVSHPFSFEWMKGHDEAFEALFRLQRYCTAYNARSCGMHVHMSAKAFTALHTYKFLRFFYGNRDFIKRVSRREGEAMEHWASLDLDPSYFIHIAKKLDTNPRRYMALNYQTRRTVECRIFRSTVSRPMFYGNIEFLKAAYDYTKATGLKDMSVDGFMQHTRKHGKMFSNFLRSFDTLSVGFEVEQGGGEV